MQFEIINLDHWVRKEYFEHYLTVLPCTYSMTVKLDITKLKETGQKLYPTMLYYLASIINLHEEFRMSLDENGNFGVYDRLEPCYTVFHKDSETFSTIWTEYSKDYETFYKPYAQDISLYGAVHRFKAKPNTPSNVFNVSMLPWESFDGFNLNCTKNTDYLLPIFTIGMYYKENGKWLLPLAIQVHHAVCDGFHVCRFVNDLRNLIEKGND